MASRIRLVIVSGLVFVFFSFNASADTLDQNQRFFISSQYDNQAKSSLTATLRQISEHVYFYVADDYWNSIGEMMRNQQLAQIEGLAKEFDQRIYPMEVQFFGVEPKPGIDGDPRLTILLAPLIEGVGGYYDTANQYLRTGVSNSNQREMIYLNVNQLANQSRMFAFLAHEFQHLISFNQKEVLRNVSDDTWLNELRSEYAPTLMGYNNVYEGSHMQRRAIALVETPSDSLTEWKNLSADYGQIGMFGEYIAERLSPKIIADTGKNKLAGFNSLAESLVSNNFSETFLGIFRDWLIANFLNDTSIDAKFGYSGAGLASIHVAPTRVMNNLGEGVTLTVSDSIKDWQGRWYDISQLVASQKNVLKVVFNSPSLTSFYIPYLVFKPDGKYQVHEFNPRPDSDTLHVVGIGSDVSRVVLMPIKKDKFSGFSANESSVQLTFSFERIVSASSIIPITIPSPSPTVSQPPQSSDGQAGYPIPSPSTTPTANYPNGSLIRARGDYRVYVINGRWRRHIISPKIFNFYPGLGFERVLEVEPSVLNQYQESALVRYAGSGRVYDIDGPGLRRWLNMSGEQFSASGRAWDSIFEVNWPELTFYPIGVNITR